jgi:aminoglycoside 3-N-acetyltransferase
MKPIGLEDIVAGLRALGVAPGDRLMVHTSLSSFGHVIGGADTLIRALLTAVGQGLLVMPYYLPPHYEGVYNPDAPPEPNTGAVPRRLRGWPGAVLSLHPSQPVVAVGAGAEEVTADHYRVSAVGRGSPLDRLARQGGKVLLLGVDQRANTTIHTGEAYAGVPYWGQPRLDRPAGRWCLMPGGKNQWVPLPETPGHSGGFMQIEPWLVQHGLIAFGTVGRARCRLMPGLGLIGAVVEFLGRDPGGLLCDQPECPYCPWARQFLPGGG